MPRLPLLRTLVSAAVLSSCLVMGLATDVPPAAADTTFTLQGGGWGHGVGMSQYGARGMAQAGLTAAQITGHYYASTSVQPVTEPGDLRIRIATVSSTTAASTGDRGSGVVAVLVDGTLVGNAAQGQTITMSGSPTQVAVRIGNQQAHVGRWAALEYVQSGSALRVAASGHRYTRGVLQVTPSGSGTIDLTVRRLSMSEYLYGLGEMPSSWPAAALQAQALTGRSYAIVKTNRNRGAGRSYDLLSSTLDQAYIGFEKEIGSSFSAWKGAVDTTAGRAVVTSSGAVAETLYSSSMGGHTEDNDYAFGSSPVSYLRATTDPYEASSGNPNYRWSRSYTGSELGAWFFGGGAVVTKLHFSGDFGRSGRINRATVTLVSTAGTRSVTGSSFRLTINRNAPTRTLLDTLLILQPIGALDGVSPAPGGLLASGWAWDPTKTDPTAVDVYVDGQLRVRATANKPRPDVDAAIPGAGPNRGFEVFVPAAAGSYRVCVYAIDDHRQSNPLLGCRQVTVGTTPVGHLEGLRRIPGGVMLTGWALDLSTSASISVHGYVNGRYAGQVIANEPRPDVGRAYPAYGDAHGFSLPLSVGAGRHELCVYAIDDQGANPSIGCRTTDVSGEPFGSLDSVVRPNHTDPYTVLASGWTIDPDTRDSTQVHAYRGAPYPTGTYAGAGTASMNRPDVAAAYPDYGAARGFAVSAVYQPGRVPMCIHAINAAGAGGNPLISCQVPPNSAPFGHLNSVTRTAPEEIRIQGWGLDADTTGAISFHVYLDGPAGSGGRYAGAFTADALRPDVGAAYPGFGDRHGIDVRLPAAANSSVYVYLIDHGGSVNPLLGSVPSV